MSARVAWLSENQVLHQQFYGQLVLKDMTDVVIRAQALVAAAPRTVHLLADTRYLDKFPTNLAVLRRAVAVPSSANLGWVVYVHNDNSLLKFFGGALSQFGSTRVRFRIFDNYAAALAFLVEMDSTLDPAIQRLTVPAPPVPSA